MKLFRRLAVWRGGNRTHFFLHITGLIKGLNTFLQSVAKKQDVFGIFTEWFRKDFDLPVASLGVKNKYGWLNAARL